MAGFEDWEAVEEALVAGDLEEAARLILKTPLLPGLTRRLQAQFGRVPAEYVHDALAEAMAETFLRVQRGADIDFHKVGGYIFTTARYILIATVEELKQRGQLFDDGRTPYHAELVGKLGGLGEITEDPTKRTAALQFLASLIDALPASDNAKQVLKVRFDAALKGDWLTDAEVAEILGKEKTSISSWWRRGKADVIQYCVDHGINRDNLEDLGTAFNDLEAEDQDREEEGDDDEEYDRNDS